MSAEERAKRLDQEMFALRRSREELTGLPPEERWAGLLALRSTAMFLQLKDVYAEFDAEIKVVGSACK